MLFIIILFSIFALICVKNTRFGVYAIIFSMPLYLFRFSIFGIPTTVLEIMIYILFLFWILNKIIANYKMHPSVISKRSDSEVRNLLNLFFALNIVKRFLLPFHFSRNDKNKTENFNSFNRFRKNNSVLLTGIGLLFLGLILSTLHSSDLRTSLGICKGWFFDPFLFFIVFVNVVKKTEHLKLSLASWVFSGVAVSLISVFYLLNNELTFDGRLKAFYISPNCLAMYLAPAFLIALFFLLNNSSLFPRRRESTATINNSSTISRNAKKIFNIPACPAGRRYSIFAVVIIISVPLFFTYSYGAFLGIFAGVIWLFYKIHSDTILNFLIQFVIPKRSGSGVRNLLMLPYKQNSYISSTKRSLSRSSFEMTKIGKFKTRLFLKILAFIILVAVISITAIKFNQITDSENRSSFHSRLMIWNASAEIIKDNPILGIGPGTFQEVYLSFSKKFDKPYLEWAVTQPHNTFLAFYLQTGLIGFVGFILILVWFFRRRHVDVSPSSDVINIIVRVVMIYILIHGLVDTMYWKNDLSLMFWIIVALLLTTLKNCATIAGQDKKGREH